MRCDVLSKKNVKFFFVIILAVFFIAILYFPGIVYAEDPVDIPTGGNDWVEKIFGTGDLSIEIFRTKFLGGDMSIWSLLATLFSLSFPLLWVAFFFVVGIGALKIVSSEGIEDKLRSGQKWLKNGVSGLAASAVIFIIANLVTYFLGFGSVFGLAKNFVVCGDVALYEHKRLRGISDDAKCECVGKTWSCS